jgi:hypothetical protein
MAAFALHAEIRRLRSTKELAESLEVGVDSERAVLVFPIGNARGKNSGTL